MTEIDARADIEVRSAHEHVVARVPLAGPVAADWARCYQRLARATDVPVRAETGPDRTWLCCRPRPSRQKRAVEVAVTDVRGRGVWSLKRGRGHRTACG